MLSLPQRLRALDSVQTLQNGFKRKLSVQATWPPFGVAVRLHRTRQRLFTLCSYMLLIQPPKTGPSRV